MSETRKIVVNRCYGGFSVSHAVAERMAEAGDEEAREHLSKYPDYKYSYRPKARDHPALITAVEELGSKAEGEYASFEIVEIPADVDWQIDEYDGMEWIAEKHRTW